jgi:hypothetical protein
MIANRTTSQIEKTKNTHATFYKKIKFEIKLSN